MTVPPHPTLSPQAGRGSAPPSQRHRAMTVRAAIIGLGRWGRSLVNAVHGKTDAIRFTAAYTRTRECAEDFCRGKRHSHAGALRGRAGKPGHRCRRAGHAAQRACRAGDGGGRRRQACPRREATHARPAERRGCHWRGPARRDRLGGRIQPPPFILRWSKSESASPTAGSAPSCRWSPPTPPRPPSSSPSTTGGRSPTRRPAARSTAVGVHSIDAMIEFGGRVRDVLATTGRYMPGLLTTPPTSCCASRMAPPASCSARSRPRPRCRSRCSATKGWRNSPGRTCRASATCRFPPRRRPGR